MTGGFLEGGATVARISDTDSTIPTMLAWLALRYWCKGAAYHSSATTGHAQAAPVFLYNASSPPILALRGISATYLERFLYCTTMISLLQESHAYTAGQRAGTKRRLAVGRGQRESPRAAKRNMAQLVDEEAPKVC